ncbi:MAG: hypothetical protein ABIJ56_07645 [Pseudomonadota bacterium]
MVNPIAKTNSEIISVHQSLPRQTPERKSPTFAQVLSRSSAILLDVVDGASSVLPGGGMLSAAVRAGKGMHEAGSTALAASTGTGVDPTAPAGMSTGPAADGEVSGEYSEFWKMQEEGRLMNLEYLKIQESLSRSNRTFSTLSNILKARHETTRTAINNIR